MKAVNVIFRAFITHIKYDSYSIFTSEIRHFLRSFYISSPIESIISLVRNRY
jgi:hypothetical protein